MGIKFNFTRLGPIVYIIGIPLLMVGIIILFTPPLLWFIFSIISFIWQADTIKGVKFPTFGKSWCIFFFGGPIAGILSFIATVKYQKLIKKEVS